MTTMAQVDSFHRFAVARLESGDADMSMDELLELWRVESMSPEELAESVAAVRAALAEMDDESAWIDADEHLAQLRSRFGITDVREHPLNALEGDQANHFQRNVHDA